MSPRVRLFLTFLAAAAAALAAANPADMPGWVTVVIAALAAGLAGVGILPPAWRVTDSNGTRAVKRNAPSRRADVGVGVNESLSETPRRGPTHGGMRRMTGWRYRLAVMVVFAWLGLGAGLLVSPVQAVGPVNAGYAADGEAADFCTPHTAGVCVARNGYVSSGRGGGAWNGVAQAWGCYWFEPCSGNPFNSSQARAQARWYDQECFIIQSSGAVTNRRRC